eukprot:9985216-Prorocentrum_lima.AAC.1
MSQANPSSASTTGTAQTDCFEKAKDTGASLQKDQQQRTLHKLANAEEVQSKMEAAIILGAEKLIAAAQEE